MTDSTHLKKVLGPLSLWGLGVGYVISGEYFGWNLGLPKGGTYGLLAAFLLITAMYVAFVFSYIEMACAIPRAGGVFVYGVRGLGLTAGYLGGIAQVVEFVFAPAAIALALGAYANTWLPGIHPKILAIAACVLFTGLNIWGVQQSAIFELVITILAVGELLLFSAVVAPRFEWANFTANAWPHGWSGAVAAIPFAIWFYLAIEGVANAAEEARNPQRDIPVGFGAAMLTLVLLAAFVLFAGIGVGGWERIVYEPNDISLGADNSLIVRAGALPSDKPLPLALGQVVTPGHGLYHLLVGIGLLGIIASLNGIILASGRAVFEMGRVGFIPSFVGRSHSKTRTPINALLVNLACGIGLILVSDADSLITIAAMGAVTLYIVSMLALIRLRQREPDLPRPYKTPLYPWSPLVALLIAIFAQATMGWINFTNVDVWWKSLTLWYVGILAAAFLYFFAFVRKHLTADDIAHFHRID